MHPSVCNWWPNIPISIFCMQTLCLLTHMVIMQNLFLNLIFRSLVMLLSVFLRYTFQYYGRYVYRDILSIIIYNFHEVIDKSLDSYITDSNQSLCSYRQQPSIWNTKTLNVWKAWVYLPTSVHLQNHVMERKNEVVKGEAY